MTKHSKKATFAGILLTICFAQMVCRAQGIGLVVGSIDFAFAPRNWMTALLGYRELMTEVKEEKCQHIHGRSFTGDVLREMTTTTHFKCCNQCHYKCDPTKTLCIGWSFDEKEGKCILYKDIFYMNIQLDAISGINDCFAST